MSLDLASLMALLLNNPAPLYWHVVCSAGCVNDMETTAQAVISQVLRTMLAQARAINAILADALHQTLDVLLPGLGSQPPGNTRKLLEAYADLAAENNFLLP